MNYVVTPPSRNPPPLPPNLSKFQSNGHGRLDGAWFGAYFFLVNCIPLMVFKTFTNNNKILVRKTETKLKVCNGETVTVESIGIVMLGANCNEKKVTFEARIADEAHIVCLQVKPLD